MSSAGCRGSGRVWEGVGLASYSPVLRGDFQMLEVELDEEEEGKVLSMGI